MSFHPTSPSPSSTTTTTTKKSKNKKKILILGSGPSGSTTALHLALSTQQKDFHITVLELSTLAPYGQGIDITNEAVTVMKRLGVLEKIKAQATGETGFALLDDIGKEIGRVGLSSSEDRGKGAFSPTQEVEIMRGTLTNILVDAAKAEGVEYRYGCTVSEIDQTSPDSVSAKIISKNDNTSEVQTFGAIIGADGLASQVRNLAFPATETYQSPYRQTDTYCAYFSMEAADSSTPLPTYSRLQHADKGRVIWLRPINIQERKLSCYLIITSPNNSRLQEISAPGAATSEERKAFLEELYSDMSGLKEEAIQGMHRSTDFYFTRIAQVSLPTWHTGRCGLVGDAAYCPSPLTGQGLTLALIGGYMIAGELASNPSDPAAAFASYQRKLEGYVKSEATIPLGGRAPTIFEPQSKMGVWALRTAFWAVSRPNVMKFIEALPNFSGEDKGKKFQVPEYPLDQPPS